MNPHQIKLLPKLETTVAIVLSQAIATDRKQILQVLVNYVQSKVSAGEAAYLNFICTHNSRRSQFSQIWAQTAADYFGVPARCFSGGVEVTAFNERAVASIQRIGFRVSKKGDENPTYFIFHSNDSEPIVTFSKLFDDPIDRADRFAAVMTCAHADENCPFIPGAESRIPLRYEDPKAFDDTLEETAKYDERSMEIAAEMFYVFSKITIPY